MIQNANEVRKANIAAMGEPLGEIYSALWQEVVIIHVHWNEYVALFGTGSEQIALLNNAAPSFFRMIQDEMWEAALLNLTRLTDPPAMTARKEQKSNLTMRALPALIDDRAIKATVENLVGEAIEATRFARDWRDRRIAHRDLKLALEQPTTPLAQGSRESVKKALKALTAVLNAVAHHYLKSETAFDLAARMGGVASLLYVLEIGTHEKEAKHKRLEESIQASDSLAAKQSNRHTMILATITMICGFGVWILSPLIWLYTIYLAYLTNFPALLAALFLPFFAQAYWIWSIYNETGTPFNSFTLLCSAWAALALIGTITRAKVEIT